MAVWDYKIRAKKDNVPIAVEYIKAKLLKVKADCRNAVLASSCEILTNIATYAYDSVDGEIFFELNIDNKSVRVTFRDRGRPFNPETVRDEDAAKGQNMGIFIAKNMTDKYSYKYIDGTNISVIEKRR